MSKREGEPLFPSSAKRSNAFPTIIDPSRMQIPLDAVTDGLFEELHCRHYLHAPPSVDCTDRSALMAWIQGQLQALCFKTDASAFGGVPCAFDDVQVSSQGGFVGDSPWLHFWVQARWLVFAPKVGHRLTGMVTSQTADHISLLLLGYFTVSIGAIQAGAHHRWSGHSWMRIGDGVSVQNGSALEFEVIQVALDANVLMVHGSLDKLASPPTPVLFSKKIAAVQYGDHLVTKKLALDGATARKRLKKLLKL